MRTTRATLLLFGVPIVLFCVAVLAAQTILTSATYQTDDLIIGGSRGDPDQSPPVVELASAQYRSDVLLHAEPLEQPSSASYQLTLAPAGWELPMAMRIATDSALPGGVVGTPYTATLTVVNATTPLTWTVISGALPAGLALTANTTTLSNSLAGTPTTAGAFNFRIRVLDSATPTPQTAEQDFTLVVKLTVTADISNWTVTQGNAFSATFSAAGGQSPYTFNVTTGNLAAGLNLSSAGLLSGPVTAGAGSYSFTVVATDAASPSNQGEMAVTMTVTVPHVIVTADVSNWTVPQGNTFSATFSASGGQSPYTFNVTTGNLPAGLNLSSAGLLSGAVTAGAGSYSFTVVATDAASPSNQGEMAVTMTVQSQLPPIIIDKHKKKPWYRGGCGPDPDDGGGGSVMALALLALLLVLKPRR